MDTFATILYCNMGTIGSNKRPSALDRVITGVFTGTEEERHEKVEKYIRIKDKILEQQGKQAFWIPVSVIENPTS
jgi:hypothetical protein